VTGRLGRFATLALGIAIGLLIAAATASPSKRSVLADLFGPNLVRGQLVMFFGGQDTEIWFDRGKITQAGGGVVTIREKDGQVVRISIAPGAKITLGGANVSPNALRKGMQAQVQRPGDAPATRIDATYR
jgi:hypothetical protein